MSLISDDRQNSPPALVTVAIPTWNNANGALRVIDCALAQDYPNIEILVSDNGSTDGDTLERGVSERDGGPRRIRLWRHNVNRGPAFNYRFLLEQSAGEFFLWMQDDDFYDHKEFIRRGVEALTGNPSAAVAFGSVNHVDAEGRLLFRDGPPHMLAGDIDSRLRNSIDYSICDHLIYGVFRRSALEDFTLEGRFADSNKIAFLRVLLKGPVADAHGMEYTSFYSLGVRHGDKRFFFESRRAAIKRDLMWISVVLSDLGVRKGWRPCARYVLTRAAVISWPLRMALGLPKPPPGRRGDDPFLRLTKSTRSREFLRD